MNLKTWNGLHYSVAADSIKTNADKDGCSVFEVNGNIGPLLILAHDMAEACYQYDLEIQNNPRWCDDCESLNCSCP